MNRFGTGRWYEIPLLALLFLCFFQSLTDFIASVFALGLLQISTPPKVACVKLLFAPLILIPRRKVSARFVVLAGALMLLGRVAGLMLDTRGKMLAAGLSTAKSPVISTLSATPSMALITSPRCSPFCPAGDSGTDTEATVPVLLDPTASPSWPGASRRCSG